MYKQLLRDRDEEIIQTVKYCREIVDRALDVNQIHGVVSIRATASIRYDNNGTKMSSPPFKSSIPSRSSDTSSFQLDKNSSSSSAISIILLLGLCIRLLSALFVFGWFFVKDQIRNLLVD